MQVVIKAKEEDAAPAAPEQAPRSLRFHVTKGFLLNHVEHAHGILKLLRCVKFFFHFLRFLHFSVEPRSLSYGLTEENKEEVFCITLIPQNI